MILKKIPFQNAANDGLGYSSLLPLYLPSITHKIVDANSFVSLFSMIQFCICHYNNHLLTFEEDKIINLSNIYYCLTFFVEDFDKGDNELVDFGYSTYLDYFKTLHNIYFESNKPKKLDNAIHELIGNIFGENDSLSWSFFRTFYLAVTYLMGCNALKEGRDSINCDDVITAYFTCFKIILNDIRPLVYQLYDEEKWKDDESWK